MNLQNNALQLDAIGYLINEDLSKSYAEECLGFMYLNIELKPIDMIKPTHYHSILAFTETRLIYYTIFTGNGHFSIQRSGLIDWFNNQEMRFEYAMINQEKFILIIQHLSIPVSPLFYSVARAIHEIRTLMSKCLRKNIIESIKNEYDIEDVDSYIKADILNYINEKMITSTNNNSLIINIQNINFVKRDLLAPKTIKIENSVIMRSNIE